MHVTKPDAEYRRKVLEYPPSQRTLVRSISRGASGGHVLGSPTTTPEAVRAIRRS